MIYHPLGHIDTFRARPVTRRSSITTLALTDFAFAAVGATSRAVTRSRLYTVSTFANFRSGPGTDYLVISVISPGTTFSLNGMEQNGFYGVNYHGAGWVYGPLVVPTDDTTTDPEVVGEARTSVAVNLRSGPGTGHQVLRVVSAGAAIQVSNTLQNGFRYIVHQGLAGWMADQYITWSTGPGTGSGTGTTFTTTARLNLRAEPSTSAKILLVIPEGATVRAAEGGLNGFRKVIYQDTTGWAASTYLN